MSYASTPVLKSALSNTAVAVKASPGKIVSAEFYNPAAAVTYVQLFDKAAGSVVVGTDTPVLSIGVPAGGRAQCPLDAGFLVAIATAATTAPTGGTAPATALIANFSVR